MGFSALQIILVFVWVFIVAIVNFFDSAIPGPAC